MDHRLYNATLLDPNNTDTLSEVDVLLAIYYLLSTFFLLFTASLILFTAFKVLIWVMPKWYNRRADR